MERGKSKKSVERVSYLSSKVDGKVLKKAVYAKLVGNLAARFSKKQVGIPSTPLKPRYRVELSKE